MKAWRTALRKKSTGEDHDCNFPGTAVLSQNRVFTSVDDRFCDILGYTHTELLGTSWEKVSHPEGLEKETTRFKSILKNKTGGFSAEKRFMTKAGETVFADITVKCIHGKTGLSYHLLVLVREIGKQQQKERVGNDHPGYNRVLIETSLDPLVTFDGNGIILDVNQAMITITGKTRDELTGAPFADCFTSPDIAHKGAMLVFEQGELRDYELRMRTPDGLEKDIVFNASVFTDESGEIAGAFAAARDITKLKQIEEIQSVLLHIAQAVSTSDNLQEFLEVVHEQLGRLIDTSNFYVALYDEENDLYSFPCHYDEREETRQITVLDLKKSLTDYVRRTGKPLLADEVVHQDLISKGEVEMVGEPSPIWLGVPFKTLHGIIGVVAVQSYSHSSLYTMRDLELLSFLAEHISLAIEQKKTQEELISYRSHLEELVKDRTGELTRANSELETEITEHKQTEAALRNSERRMSEIINSLPDATVVVDRDGMVIAWNKAMEEMSGIPAEDMLHKGNFEYAIPFYGERRPILLDHIFKAHSELKSLYSVIEHESDTLVGEAFTPALGNHGRYLYATAHALYDSQGNLAGAIESIRDITERKKVQQALTESEERFRDLVLSTSDWVWEVNTQGCYTYCSEQVKSVLGYTAEEILGKTPFDLMQPVEGLHIRQMFENIVKTGTPIVDLENWNISKGGKRICLLTNGVPMFGDSGELIGYRGLDRDITSRKIEEEERSKLEKQILQTQKLESLGVLAGGIAHDFNNLLVGILGNADLALDSLSPVSPARANIIEIETAAKRAADLSRQMLAYSGRGQFVIEAINLNDIIEEMTHLLEVSISKKAILKLNLADNLPSVEVDITQIRQVIMNLITNASEAIGDRSGMISVSTGAMECDNDYFDGTYFCEDLEKGIYVYFEIADTGTGINNETLTKIFDPFYTTKSTGRGLGLAAVLGIVRGHKGALKVYSESRRGTSFKILLPGKERRVESRNKKPVELSTWKGSGTILLVDDEETIRTVGKKMLQRIGFTVVTADDGCQALELFSNNPHEFKCVILDLTMPHMSGEDAFRELKRIRKDIPILLSSGYNEKDVLDHFTGRNISGFIQKPYSLATLSSVLSGILDGQQ